MKKLQPTTQYKKDYKKYRNNPKKVEALKEVLKMLMNEQPIPAEYKPHMLLGEYKGCMEYQLQSIINPSINEETFINYCAGHCCNCRVGTNSNLE
jgi:mRNA interferase YafQ